MNGMLTALPSACREAALLTNEGRHLWRKHFARADLAVKNVYLVKVVALALCVLHLCSTYGLYISDRAHQTLSESASVPVWSVYTMDKSAMLVQLHACHCQYCSLSSHAVDSPAKFHPATNDADLHNKQNAEMMQKWSRKGPQSHALTTQATDETLDNLIGERSLLQAYHHFPFLAQQLLFKYGILLIRADPDNPRALLVATYCLDSSNPSGSMQFDGLGSKR
ncbi:hypothetical protein VNO77_32012 [Canavalia gladiata]|uniref:Uncharacterized protein n=1 Tax=Canavalia gladiata TaxID=3824 RepID=A0AAN9KTP1_CANGL